MKKQFVRLFSMLIVVLLTNLAGWNFIYADDESDIEVILEQINIINTFSDTYTGVLQVASFAPEEETRVNAYTLYVKGLDNILMVQTAPEKDVGKKILLKKDKVWFYFPKARQALLINPRNTLLGTVSIGDVMSPPVLDLYEFTYAEQVTRQGQEMLKLEFIARTNKSPYGKVVYYYHHKRILASDAYTRSDILLKRAFFGEFVTNSEGAEYASKIKVENGVNPEYYALIKMSNLKEVKDLPDYYFMVEGLDKIKG